MRILIVDDEAPARERLRALVEEIGEPYRIAGEAGNGQQALERCRGDEVDLVLMDIRMPGMDGIEAAAELDRLETPPAVIFVTAYEEHALEAFRGPAVDYLLKPIRRSHLEKALRRASVPTRPQQQALAARDDSGPEHIAFSYRGGVQRIPVDAIIYFQADHKYVTVRHTGGEALLEESLKSLESRMGERFFRIHRNALVARARLIGLEKTPDGRALVRMADCDERLEVSRRHLPDVRRLLKGGS